MAEETREGRAARLGIELAAVSDPWLAYKDQPYGASEGEVETSKAISAKRLADAMQRIERHLGQLAGELAHPEYGIGPTLRTIGNNIR